MDEVHVEMRVTDCRTVCRHCMVCGTTGDFVMPLNTIEKVFRQMEESAQRVEFFPLDDLVAYPDWIRLLKLMNAYGLNSDVLTTTGAGGTFTPHMALLRELGKSTLQLAFHGLATTHNQFVGASGAFEDLIDQIQAGMSEGFDVWIMIFLGKHNIGEVTGLIDLLVETGIAIGDIGVTTSQYLGRSVAFDRLRLTSADVENLPENLKPRPKHYTETEWLEKVHADDAWDRPAFTGSRRRTELFIDKNLDVYLRNWNPYGMPGIRQSVEGFRLGTLAEEPLNVILERYLQRRPRNLQLLEDISIRELAQRVGRRGQELYPHEDVPRVKWPYLYLKAL